MKSKIAHKKWLTALIVMGLAVLTATPALAWWSSWYAPGFTSSYAPSSYKHGQWNSSVGGGTEAFGSRMKWNQTQGNGVRNYSNTKQWISFCGFCYSYYTHDHTDTSNKLDGYAFGSNVPNPKYDWDDDDGNGRKEEGEVTVLNQSFPTTNSVYYFHTYFKRKASGTGMLYETPAISAKPFWTSEYQTWRYDSHEVLGYFTYGPQNGPEKNKPGAPYSMTLPTEPFPVHIWGIEDASVMNVGLGYSLQTLEELSAYARWVRETPVSELQQAGVKHALTVVTFNEPVTLDVVGSVSGQGEYFIPVMVKAIYTDLNNPDPNTSTWTLQVSVEAGDDYVLALDELAADLAANHGEDDVNTPALKMLGIVAITAWLPLDTVETLNTHELIYLADASPSYMRWVASQTDKTQEIQRALAETQLLNDGFASFIRPSFNDVYPELLLFSVKNAQ